MRAERAPANEVRDPAGLRIGGVTPFSTTDWPGKLAAVLFLQGCPWRCGYCHNPHLQPAIGRRGARLRRRRSRGSRTRRGLLDAVVFSGGEPTAQAALAGPRCARCAGRGFAIGLHTGGAYPRRLDDVIRRRRLDRARREGAGERLCARSPASEAAAPPPVASLRLVAASGVDYEVRTTVHPDLVPDDALVRLADELAVARRAPLGAAAVSADRLRGRGAGRRVAVRRVPRRAAARAIARARAGRGGASLDRCQTPCQTPCLTPEVRGRPRRTGCRSRRASGRPAAAARRRSSVP